MHARVIALAVVASLALSAGAVVAAPPSPWTPLPAVGGVERAARARAVESKLYTLDLPALRSTLAGAPREFSTRTAAPAILLLPAPDGSLVRFAVEETALLHPELQAKFPQIRTYWARGIDDPSLNAQLDDTEHGFNAQVLGRLGRWYVTPLREAGAGVYQCLALRNAAPPLEPFTCGVTERSQREMFRRLRAGPLPTPQVSGPVGTQLRTFRVAVGATGEYTASVGGTVSAALSSITTVLNQVAGVFRTELSVSFQLVANNDRIVFTNAATDPYTNADAGAILTQNQMTLDALIGDANYDFGHVFKSATGGLAQLEVICAPEFKAMGTSGYVDPFGVIFWQGYVAHEFGHQFGAGHTFNSEVGKCGNGNRDPVSAVEPGAGATIMSYAASCQPDSYQNLSVPYYHANSFLEMSGYLATVACGTFTENGNRPPEVESPPTRVIPNRTAFALVASGADPDGDVILWAFDQVNFGPASSLADPDNGSSPLFRFLSPTVSPIRAFPELAAIDGAGSPEKFPSYVGPPETPLRALQFRIVARDQRGGVTTVPATVQVATQTGPFRVTSPSGAPLWAAGSTVAVQWDVAGTTANGIDTASVNVRLSTDGGQSFPIVLAAGVPNNGSASILVPSLNTTTARVKVEAVGNIFFALNDRSFRISPAGPTVTPAPTPQPTPTPVILPTPTGGPTPTPTFGPTPTPFPGGASRLGNVSTRLRVGTGDGVAIAGFVLQGSGSRRVLIRALGPSLTAFGVTGALANPNLELVAAGGATLATNDDWRATQQTEIAASGFAPSSDLEAGIVAQLAPGAYTAILRGTGGAGGVGLVEVYDLDGAGGDARLGNLSTRGQVLTGEDILIGGFVIGGGAPKRVLIRALGPSLAIYGVGGALGDPVVTLKNAAGVTLLENDDWSRPQGLEIRATGLAPVRRIESGLLVTLEPGAYTALVTGYGGATGIALFEVYELP